MKLELKHLAPYLPYGLKYIYVLKASGFFPKGTIDNMSSLDISLLIKNNDIKKPILRPLSDLVEKINFKGVVFTPIKFLLSSYDVNNGWDYSNFNDFKVWAIDENGSPTKETMTLVDYLKLFEWHFDVFGLIEKGLAIDINTITK
jgi:hypothetical protein